ncbi:hypothetical protein BMETH_388_3 [methanotrophic bacterial endosymbiont of Bathymodiolus sp.]|nr:hypothetical protein BMETH_388_3 [methanotrophic bacterial endosymbiont of Bathymodiolus sp.]
MSSWISSQPNSCNITVSGFLSSNDKPLPFAAKANNKLF